MPIIYTCDICGSGEGAAQDYDGRVLCRYHMTLAEIKELQREYDDKKEWLEQTHLKHLDDLEKKIKAMELLVVNGTIVVPLPDIKNSGEVQKIAWEYYVYSKLNGGSQ